MEWPGGWFVHGNWLATTIMIINVVTHITFTLVYNVMYFVVAGDHTDR